MTIDIVMPKIGLNMEEGVIVEWMKKEGDEIKHGDVLFILETDKVTVESEAQQAGTLVKILVQEGERVPVRTPVALMVGKGETYVEAHESTTQISSHSSPEERRASTVVAPTQGDGRKYFASPKAKYYARQHKLNLMGFTQNDAIDPVDHFRQCLRMYIR